MKNADLRFVQIRDIVRRSNGLGIVASSRGQNDLKSKRWRMRAHLTDIRILPNFSLQKHSTGNSFRS